MISDPSSAEHALPSAGLPLHADSEPALRQQALRLANWPDFSGGGMNPARFWQRWPLLRGWRNAFGVLRARFREDRLGMTAGSLTFTTLMAMVPLLAVMLAVFTAFPIFGRFQEALQTFLLQSLVPDSIARPVIKSLTVFASKANRVGTAGLAVLLVSALSLLLTIDRALNAIWRVPKPRPIAQRVLVYWALATLGPLLLGVSLTATSYAISASQGFVSALPGGVSLAVDLLEFSLFAGGATVLFHFVPNTHVRWRHALAGGVFVALGLEAARRALGWYVGSVSSFSAIYGAFATLPIFLIWLYLSWVIVLLGAMLAAYAPVLGARLGRIPDQPGAQLDIALQMLALLNRAGEVPARGLSRQQIATRLHTDPVQLEPVLGQLVVLDWLGRLDEAGEQRYVLLCPPGTTPAGPVLERFGLVPSAANQRLLEASAWRQLMLADILPVMDPVQTRVEALKSTKSALEAAPDAAQGELPQPFAQQANGADGSGQPSA